MLSLLLWLAACTPTDTGKPADSAPTDLDGDGVPAGEDCADDDAAVYPGAAETCDGRDQDCDGTVDEDATDAATWYADADADTFGDPAVATVACTAPGFTVADDQDCDDGNPAVHPGADELCNDVDDDCDGVTDPSSAEGTLAWYEDLDGDGQGNPDREYVACARPTGWVADSGDCDDEDPTAYVGGAEVCGGGDEDCDGETDEGVGSTWYDDDDGDGFGAGDGYLACDGDVSNADDCDDSRDDVFPGATETCDDADQDCDGTVDEDAGSTWYTDADGDGYGDATTAVVACEGIGVPFGGDCDDLSSAIHPGAGELCDAIDEDCDGSVDEDAADAGAWFADADGDGFGAGEVYLACEGGVANADDCDDTNADVSPDGVEVCGGSDEDCDGTTDVGATDETSWYPDGDGDGYGAGEPYLACVGEADNADDCQDADAGIHPGAPEACDSIDQDCDGVIDNDAPPTRTAYADLDGDGYGDPAVTTPACEIEAGWSADNTDCDDTTASISPAVEEVCGDSIDQDCDGLDGGDGDCAPEGTYTATELDLSFTGATTADSFGKRAVVGDFDRDGHPDLAIAAPAYGSTDTGGVAIFYGPVSSHSWSGADAFVVGEDYDALGSSLAVMDLDGDGWEDLVIGAPTASSSNYGAVYGFAGGEVRWSGTLGTADADFTLAGLWSNGYAGYALLVMDLDGDEVHDLLVGAPYAAPHGSGSGEAYVVPGGLARGSHRLGDVTRSIRGGASGDYLGGSFAAPGDVDGDGAPDLLIGCPLSNEANTYAGTAFIVEGPLPARPYDLAEVRTRITGINSNDTAGEVVAGGDINGDGYADIVVAASGDDTGGSEAGRVVVFYGPLPPVRFDLDDADVSYTGVAGDDLGTGLVALDLDADGRMDVAIGSPDADPDESKSGSADVWYGDGTSVRISGDGKDENLGDWLGAGDVDGDGYPDLLVGVPGVGELRVLYGGSHGVDVIAPVVNDVDDDADGDGFSEAAGDCDDTRDGEHPGAAEVCESGLDEDCDGVDAPCFDSGLVDLSSAVTRITGASGDETGRSIAFVGDVDGDGYGDLLVGSWGDDDSGSAAGTAALYLGPLAGGTLDASASDLKLSGEYTADYAGYGVSGGDINGDGLADLVVAAWGSRGGAGKVYVVYGGVDPDGTLATANVTISGLLAETGFAMEVVADGDLDGDGFDDIVISALDGESTLPDAGMLYVFRGGMVDGDYALSDADTVIEGEQASDEAGTSFAYAGDVDADGRDDLLIGAPGQDQVTTSAGKAYLLYGPLADGIVNVFDADAGFLPDSSADGVGLAVTGGDLNGDGYSDVAVGVPYLDTAASDAGGVCVWFGPVSRTRHYCGDADAVLTGKAKNDHAGSHLATGDMDGDGKDELVVSATDNDDGGTTAGAVYVVPGTSLASGALATLGITYVGDASDEAGDSLAVGDLDADGFAELAIGASTVAEVAIVAGGWTAYSGTSAAVVDRTADADGDGASPEGGDCDDTNAAIGRATAEVCGNGIDDDCDGDDRWCAPSGDWSVYDSDMPILYGETSTYSFASFTGAGGYDLDGDGGDDLALGNDYFGSVDDEGIVYVLSGPPHDGYTMLGYSEVRIVGEASNDRFGASVTPMADANGDGQADLAVSASGNSRGGVGAGTVFLFFGGAGLAAHTTASTADVIFTGNTTTAIGGSADVGDVDGDGSTDLFFGSSYYDGPGSNIGAGLLLYGPWTGGELITVPSVVDALFYGETDNDNAGSVAGAGDVDGDGMADFMVAAPYRDEAGSSSGKVYFLYGGVWGGSIALADADAAFLGVESDVLGLGGRAGDLDGDGDDEWFFASYYYDSGSYTNAGAAWIMRDPPASGVQSAYVATTVIHGSSEESNANTAKGLGDIDGDGKDDFGLGAEYNDRAYSNAGAIMVFYGDLADGTYDTGYADGFVLGSGSAGVGGTLAAAGDLNRDGFADLYSCPGTASGTGYGWIVFGGER